MKTELVTHSIGDTPWVYRIRSPEEKSQRILLMLHGWTGDENAMWVFVDELPPDYWLVAPRAPYSAPDRGYSWREIVPGTWGSPSSVELQPAAESLVSLVDDLLGEENAKCDLLGFSQGAALAYVIALLFPERVGKVAALSGFIPSGGEILAAKRSVTGISFYIAHGTQDEYIPIGRAREAVAILKKAGARVTYCEADIGHKMSAGCFNGLTDFFQTN